MSTTTVTYSSATSDADLAALRRREAAAREANRRRLGVANSTIATQETRFQVQVARRDEAARRLPDFDLAVPALPQPGTAAASDAAACEAFAARLTQAVHQFSRQLDAAIAEAEERLARRLRRATAWREASALEAEIRGMAEECAAASTRLGDQFRTAQVCRPAEDTELEGVEAYLASLRVQQQHLRSERARLQARTVARERARDLGGAAVSARDAESTLSAYAEAQREQARAALRAQLAQALVSHGFTRDGLPEALRRQMEDAVECGSAEGAARVKRLLAREAAQRHGIAQALALLSRPPERTDGHSTLARRWTSLAERLTRIAAGLEDWVASVEREYAQLECDARRSVNAAFARADWVRAMAEEGFEVCEREDGDGLVVIDLEQPETWLEATPLENQEGGFGAVLELKTDAPSLLHEANATASVCSRLARVARAAAPEVAAESEVIEREAYITRARRPKAAAIQG